MSKAGAALNPTSSYGWDDQIVIRKKAGAASTGARPASGTGETLRPLSAAALAAAKRPTVSNPVKGGPDGRHLAKVDREETDFHIKTVPLDVGRAIMKGRQDKGMTQKDLATLICEKPQIVGEYESGKAKPDQKVMSKMERALGIKLRGKDIGSPIAPRGSSAAAAAAKK